MGYYIAVPCKSAKSRNDMLAFLAQHFRDAWELFDWVPRDNRMERPIHGTDICAYAKDLEIGWYRNAGWSPEHGAYADSLLRWIALKIGRQMITSDDEVPGYGPLDVAFTVYEGQRHPVILQSQCPNAPDGWDRDGGYQVCDDLGWDRSMRGPTPDEDPDWHEGMKPYMLEMRQRKAKADPIIRAELERLEALWSSR
jgi:hypothetical protein